jgi:hypothetical protein
VDSSQNEINEEDTMKLIRRFATPALAGVLLLGALAACDREGPLERAGERVDRAAERTADRAEKAVD